MNNLILIWLITVFSQVTVFAYERPSASCSVTADCKVGSASCSAVVHVYDGGGGKLNVLDGKCSSEGTKYLSCSNYYPQGEAKNSYVCCDSNGYSIATGDLEQAKQICSSY